MAEKLRILAATDFSAAADRASRRAASIAATDKGVLHLAHVLPPQELLAQVFAEPLEKGIEAPLGFAKRALAERAERLGERFGTTPICHTLQGRAHEAVLAAIESVQADLVVLGAQGEREGVLPSNTVGDTALRVAARSRVPVLLARREAPQPYARVIGCAKGDRADSVVVEWTSRMSPDDLIHILHVYTVPYERRLREWGASRATLDVYATREREQRVQQLSAMLERSGLPAARARLHVDRGEPLAIILQKAIEWRADLLVVGRRRGPEPLASESLGNVARDVAFAASMDVMIVPPSGGADEGVHSATIQVAKPTTET
jgi:nucleotide-binding universal stress UspA family protein